MFVRVRTLNRPEYHRAAFHSCRWLLAVFAAAMVCVVGALVYIQLTPGIYIADVHTRMPALFVGLALALLAQGGAIGVYYCDHLRCQSRRAATRDRERC